MKPEVQTLEAGPAQAAVAAEGIYLDYASTTPADPRVIEAMMGCLGQGGHFGNPASRSHSFGWDAEAEVSQARSRVAALLNCDEREIVWTSGATESDNLAIKGAAHFYGEVKGRHIITSSIEHKAVLDTCRQLEREGFEVTLVHPDARGQVQPQTVAEAIREDTCLVSVMHANNEVGTINDIDAISRVCTDAGVLFHTDAAQSAGKIPIDLQRLSHVGLLSMSGHKLYGPKGIGALFVRRRPRVRLSAQMHGGGHERGMRSGTLPTHQCVGMGVACDIARREMPAEAARLAGLKQRLWQQLSPLEAVQINGYPQQSLPGLLNVSFAYVEGESLIMSLKGVAVSSGSACTSASLEPSYVLRALGLNDELAHSSLRFSIGRFTTEQQVDQVAERVLRSVERLRELSPLWDMYRDGVDLDKVQWTHH